jgi:hypothetical protein
MSKAGEAGKEAADGTKTYRPDPRLVPVALCGRQGGDILVVARGSNPRVLTEDEKKKKAVEAAEAADTFKRDTKDLVAVPFQRAYLDGSRCHVCGTLFPGGDYASYMEISESPHPKAALFYCKFNARCHNTAAFSKAKYYDDHKVMPVTEEMRKSLVFVKRKSGAIEPGWRISFLQFHKTDWFLHVFCNDVDKLTSLDDFFEANPTWHYESETQSFNVLAADFPPMCFTDSIVKLKSAIRESWHRVRHPPAKLVIVVNPPAGAQPAAELHVMEQDVLKPCGCAKLPRSVEELPLSALRTWEKPIVGRRVRLIRPLNDNRGLHAIVVQVTDADATFQIGARTVTWPIKQGEELDWEYCVPLVDAAK